jgi:hypothetical protein
MLLATAIALDPRYARNLTIYHVNPHHMGAVPKNMDTGDLAGDLFFDLFDTFILPLACNASGGARIPNACSNAEVVSDDLVVNKLTVQVDSRFGDYAECNIGMNGTDHHHPCKTGTYCCFCDNDESCSAAVGAVNLTIKFLPQVTKCRNGAPEWDCFKYNAVRKITDPSVGTWFSTLNSSMCTSADRSIIIAKRLTPFVLTFCFVL